jgi:hypothetical protein
MFDVSGAGGRSRLVWTTAKVALAIAVLSVLATRWLSHGALDQQGAVRVALAGRADEPTMTGTLGKARDVRLDPCAAPRRP